MQTTPDRNSPQNQPATCPLARDQHGNPIELPPGAAGWRVRRKTGGRPRILLDVQKQPMLVPLHFTLVDLDDVLAPGAYLLDIVDNIGEPLALTIGVSVGQLRNADGRDDDDDEGSSDDEQSVMPTLPATGSDTRLVLEANVRATQLAFLHNQKTLELGLKMAESLREGVQVLVEAQADWIKSIASTRGFFRNAPAPQLTPPSSERHEDDEYDGDEEEDAAEDDDMRDPEQRPEVAAWLEFVGPVVGIACEKFGAGLASKLSPFATAFGGAPPNSNRAAIKANAAPQATAATNAETGGNAEAVTAATPEATSAASAEAAMAADAKVRAHFMAILARIMRER